jgi:hypothetical protein
MGLSRALNLTALWGGRLRGWRWCSDYRDLMRCTGLRRISDHKVPCTSCTNPPFFSHRNPQFKSPSLAGLRPDFTPIPTHPRATVSTHLSAESSQPSLPLRLAPVLQSELQIHRDKTAPQPTSPHPFGCRQFALKLCSLWCAG